MKIELERAELAKIVEDYLRRQLGGLLPSPDTHDVSVDVGYSNKVTVTIEEKDEPAPAPRRSLIDKVEEAASRAVPAFGTGIEPRGDDPV
jgi:hypothetical protein